MKKIQLKVNHLQKNGIDYLVQYLGFLGIKDKDIGSFLFQPIPQDEDNPRLLVNIDKAAETLYNKMNNNAKVFVQVDSDTDGYTSSAVLISYLKERWPNADIIYRLHKGKEHGIILDTIPEDRDLILIPDAGSNQFDEQNQLCEQGKTVIILDHHEISEMKETKAIIVNNQISMTFTNKSLSGVGVVYMLLKFLDQTYFNDILHRNYLDLTAVGIIADAMNMNTLGNNYISYFGLNDIRNKFLKELATKQSRGIKDPSHLTKIDVAFYIAPVINGCIRSGSDEDKEMVFRALTENNCEEQFVTTWRGVSRSETLYEYAVRLATNAKSRQDSAKKKAFERLCEIVRENELDKHNIIIVPLNEADSMKVTANLTGLVAMELVKEYNKPVLVLRHTNFEGQDLMGGSGRNGNFYGLPSLLDKIHESNLCEYGEGHGNAFGVFIKEENINQLREFFDNTVDKSIFEDKVYEVDYYFHSYEDIDLEMLEEFANYDKLWGNSIPQPKFAMEFDFTAADIKIMGKDKSSLKISHDGIDFVVFKNPELIDEIKDLMSGHVTVVGSPQFNEWMGNRNIQIMIDDISISKNTTAFSATNLLDLI